MRVTEIADLKVLRNGILGLCVYTNLQLLQIPYSKSDNNVFLAYKVAAKVNYKLRLEKNFGVNEIIIFG